MQDMRLNTIVTEAFQRGWAVGYVDAEQNANTARKALTEYKQDLVKRLRVKRLTSVRLTKIGDSE